MKRKTPLGGMDNSHSSSEPRRPTRNLTEAERNERRHRQNHPFQRTQPRPALVMQPEERRRIQNRLASVEAARSQGNLNLSKKELRTLKRERKSLKAGGKVRTDLNILFAQQNIKDLPTKKQFEYIGQLMDHMRGNMMSLVRALDSTKVIQTAVKYGSKEQVFEMASELKGNFIQLSCELYSHLTVQRMLEYGKEDTRRLIVSELMKAVVRLVTHKLASTVVDYAIMIAADENTKRLALQYIVSRKYISMPELDEETGNPLSLFDILAKIFSVPRMADTAKDVSSFMESLEAKADGINAETSTSISDSNSDNDKSGIQIARKHLLKNMEKFLIAGIEKETVSTGIYQSILHAYMSFCSRFEFESMFELLIPHICEIQNVEAGTLAVSVMIGRSFYKPSLRKAIMKAISDSNLVVPMACEKVGYLTVIRMLQCIDDTRLLDKRVLKALWRHLDVVLFHDFGRLVVLSILLPFSDTRYKNGPLFNEACPTPIDIDTFKSVIIPKLKANSIGDTNEDEKKGGDDEDDDDPYDLANVTGDFSRIDADDHSTWSVIPVRLRPISRKPFTKRTEELLNYFWVRLLDFCRSNVQDMLTHYLARAVIYEILRKICEKADENSEDALDKKEVGLVDSVIKSCLKDRWDIIVRTMPKEPEYNFRRQMEFLSTSPPGFEGTEYTPEELKQQEVVYHSSWLIRKLEYAKHLTLRKMIGGAQKARENVNLDTPCAMNHRDAHRKIRQLTKDSAWFRSKFLSVLVQQFSGEKNPTAIPELLKMRGVFVFVQLAESCTEEEKTQLRDVLLEPAQTHLFATETSESKKDKKMTGLKQLIALLE